MYTTYASLTPSLPTPNIVAYANSLNPDDDISVSSGSNMFVTQLILCQKISKYLKFEKEAVKIWSLCSAAGQGRLFIVELSTIKYDATISTRNLQVSFEIGFEQIIKIIEYQKENKTLTFPKL